MKKHLLYSLLFSSVLLISGCEKPSNKYPFTVRVVIETFSGDFAPVANVGVVASAPVPDAIPYFEGNTNQEGYIEFEYDNEAVLQIVATRGTNPPSFIGCGFVKLEMDENVIVTIVLQEYDPSQQGC